jgi:hypothetical protein
MEGKYQATLENYSMAMGTLYNCTMYAPYNKV